MLSRSRTHVLGKTQNPIATAMTESTQVHPVNQITTAPAITPTDPSMSLQTSR
ncbi:Uncharacterised protein [Mycobacterium tuberculosis]|nr:Uncharacterised protein [Mycobacterium tuberculosis]